MIAKTFVEEMKHIITWFVNVYSQYDELYFFSEGVWTPCLLEPHFGHPVMKILAKTLLEITISQWTYDNGPDVW